MDTDDAGGTGGEPEPTGTTGSTGEDQLTPAQLAAIEAAKAAKRARKAQRKAQEQAEEARRLAEEYARLAEHGSGAVSVAKPAAARAEPEPDLAPEPAVDHGVTTRSRVPLVTAAVALALCLAFAVAGLIVFLTKSSPSNGDAAVRDTVTRLAAQDIKILNTMDYRNVDEDLQRWADASTGTLHKQVTSATGVEKQQIQKAQKIATADVKYQAITSLDSANGSASVIASVDVNVKSTNGQAAVHRERLIAEMTRVGSTWKVSSLGQVPVSNP